MSMSPELEITKGGYRYSAGPSPLHTRPYSPPGISVSARVSSPEIPGFTTGFRVPTPEEIERKAYSAGYYRGLGGSEGSAETRVPLVPAPAPVHAPAPAPSRETESPANAEKLAKMDEMVRSLATSVADLQLQTAKQAMDDQNAIKTSQLAIEARLARIERMLEILLSESGKPVLF